MDIGGAELAEAATPAGLIDKYVRATALVLVGGGTPFFTAVDSWGNLTLMETRAFPDGVVLTRYETRRPDQAFTTCPGSAQASDRPSRGSQADHVGACW